MRDEPWPRYGLLLVIVTTVVALQGAVEPGAVQQVIVTVLLAAALVLAFRLARLSRPMITLAYTLAAAGIAFAVIRALTDVIGDSESRLMSAALVALGAPAVALSVVRNLRASGQVRIQAVAGVLTLYMLIGMLFANVYGAIDRVGGDPVFARGVEATVSNCIYFSFVTLATVGYGDITARTDVGHTLSVFEALVGQIYLVTVVSLIVSNLGRARTIHPNEAM